MFDFNGIKKTVTEDDEVQLQQNKKLDLNLVLENIDLGNYSFYETLSEQEKKQFQPYIIQRWLSALDDSVLLTYKSKTIEGVFGDWKKGGKDALNELKDEMVSNGISCFSISKYEHAKYDWRIKFSVKGQEDADKIISILKDFSITSHEIVKLVDSLTYKYHLIMLNDMVNDGMWQIQSYPDLAYELMCAVSSMSGSVKKTHTWLPFTGGMKNVDMEIFNIIKKTQPIYSSASLNIDEYKILLTSYSTESFDDMLKEYGYQDSERKNLLKSFNKEYSKYAKN